MTVQNIFYAMNSLISFTDQGGIVSFKDSVFHRIEICGSLLNPDFYELTIPSLSTYITANYLSMDQMDALLVLR